MKRWRRWWIVLLAVVLVVVALRLTVWKPAALEVEVVTIERGVVEDVVTNSQAGTVRARRRSKLGAERAGRVTAMPHREGAAVKKGEPLVRLDTSTASERLLLAESEREVAEATRASVQASFDLAHADFDRSASLLAQRVVSQGEFDQAKSVHDRVRADLAAADASLARARANVRLARDDLDHMTVVAPYDGVVAARLVEVGESVIPGQPVIEIVAPEALYVSARMDEIDIGRLRIGLAARVTLDPYRGENWRGRVSRVFPVVDDRQEQNRTLEVEVDLEPDATKPQARPGVSADVVIVVDQKDGVLRVPTFALMEGKRVLVVKDGKAATREVVTGLRNWEWTEVESGLAEGEQVITSLDRPGVKDGAAVRPSDAAGNGRGAASAGK